MLRFVVLIAAVPLIAGAAIKVQLDASPAARPCIAVGGSTIEVGSEPWNADLHVDFTDDPKLATVRVGLADSASAADIVLVDDGAAIDDNACGVTAAAQSVAIASDPAHRTPVIYLAQDGPADYRVFVQSSRFSVRDAAALIVSAHANEQTITNSQRMADAAP